MTTNNLEISCISNEHFQRNVEDRSLPWSGSQAWCTWRSCHHVPCSSSLRMTCLWPWGTSTPRPVELGCPWATYSAQTMRYLNITPVEA